MKLLNPLLLILALAVHFPLAHAQQKVAVVMSGGGAKGMGHIGALKVIEQAGIPVDIVVGTSMGSIIGGLYSIGYKAADLDTMVRMQDWEYLLTDKVERSRMTIEERDFADNYLLKFELQKNIKSTRMGGLIRGDNLRTLFNSLTLGYNDSISFYRLPIPFACVATDLVSGEEFVFHSGVLATAMRASMAIPGAFEPVLYGDRLLIDGGMKNNFPIDVAKAMGADIVIGLTVQEEKLKTAEEMLRMGDVLSQVLTLTTRNKYDENLALADLVIRIPTASYGTASFTHEAIDSLIRMGYTAALEKASELQTLKSRLASTSPPHRVASPAALADSFCIASVSYDGISPRDVKMIRRKVVLPDTGVVSRAGIFGTIDLIRSSDNYSNVNYFLQPHATSSGTYDLHFTAEEKYNKTIRIGARFDTEDIATIMLHGNFRFRTRIPTRLELMARLTKRYRFGVKYIAEPASRRRMEAEYTVFHNDFNIYNDGRRAYNTSYNEHRVGFALSDQWFRNLMYRFGARLQHFHFTDLIANGTIQNLRRNDFFANYFFELKYNSFDSRHFPTRGSVFEAGFTLITDDFVRMKSAMPPSVVNTTWRRAVPLGSTLTLLPSVYARGIFGKNVPNVYTNMFGGHSPGYYTDHQIPFAGINGTEIAQKIYTQAGLKLRKRFGKHYLSAYTDYALTAANLGRLLPDGRHLLGVGLSYELQTPIGPIGAYLGYFNKAEKPNLYISLGASF